MDPNDYHEIGQRHLKYQRLVACFRLVFRAVWGLSAIQGGSQERLLEELALGHVCKLSELMRQKQTPG